MLAVVGQVLPLAIAGALSSVPIAAVLTLLLGGRGLGPAVLFALGYVVAVFALTVGATALLGRVLLVRLPASGAPALALSECLLGAAAIAAGWVVFRRPVASGPNRWSRLLSSAVGTVRPVVALVVGAVLAFRPKSLLLASGVGIVLAPADLAPVPTAVLLGANAVVMTATVTGPIVFALVGGDSARSRLEQLRAWLAHNARAVTVVVLVLVGAVLVGDGLGRF
ncbi:GAP family protein [Curtobacterium sp. PhB115]|uniref:GAP family protein n=1 Tax=Curtobacterium sp. PhB115 TaxID=2485173 RepID=UPI000FAD40BC|nr:GAP family protein [Curtobacterium sp. PhB115]ROP74607.1 Sap-like sulfolipid-1-addressing protein [Curtobacterium sp. PhB115]